MDTGRKVDSSPPDTMSRRLQRSQLIIGAAIKTLLESGVCKGIRPNDEYYRFVQRHSGLTESVFLDLLNQMVSENKLLKTVHGITLPEFWFLAAKLR